MNDVPDGSADTGRRSTMRGAILFDRRRFLQAGDTLLEPGHWPVRRSGNDSGGRGAVWFVEDAGGAAVLRHYRRGGLMGRINRDRYLWSGERQTRSFREFRLLQELNRRGLRVPVPLAAGYTRQGLFYQADLLTALVPGAQTLAQRLLDAFPDPVLWRAIGATLARFHAEGAYHADLNAHNLLIDPKARTWLIDFDRGELRSPSSWWQQANLRRLLRSLEKLGAPAHPLWSAAWTELERGYADGNPPLAETELA